MPTKLTATQRKVIDWAREKTQPDGTFRMFGGYTEAALAWYGAIHAPRATITALRKAGLIEGVQPGQYRLINQ